MTQQTITINATLPAWLPNWESVDNLTDAIRREQPQRAADMLSFTACKMDKGERPYLLVGEAQITVTITSHDKLVTAQIAALNAELEQERAKSVMRQNAIMDRISKLTALTMTVDA